MQHGLMPANRFRPLTAAGRPARNRQLVAWKAIGLLFLAAQPVTGAGTGTETLAESAPRGPQPQAVEAADSLNIGPEDRPDAQQCLTGLGWKPGRFKVQWQPAGDDRSGCDYLVRFPSAVPSGQAELDTVVLEWYVAREQPVAGLAVPGQQGAEADQNREQSGREDGDRDADRNVQQNTPAKQRKQPAVVVVHESGRGMTVGRLFARTLRTGGVHTFLVQLPHYGHRRVASPQPEDRPFDQIIRQSVADVRRARDAVASLPQVDTRHISLQGTSLGGFVATTVGSLDRGYQLVFLMLCGGDLHQVITSGRNEAAALKRRLEKAGLKGEQLRAMLDRIEPSRIAHRLNPKTTWLYSARDDRVVPLASAKVLADAARMDNSHHIVFVGNHYSAIAHFLPVVMHILREVRQGAGGANPPGQAP